MAVGPSPKFTTEMPLDGLTPKQFLVVACETARQMRWNLTYLGADGIIAHTNRGNYSWNAEVRVAIGNGDASVTSTSTGSEIADWGKNKKIVQAFISAFHAQRAWLPVDAIAMRYQYLQENNLLAAEGQMNAVPPAAKEYAGAVIDLFIPRKNYFITPLLIDINILVFLAMAISGVSIMLPSNDSLLQWGANFRPMTMGGEWWRLITCVFLHIGVMHLLMNMYALVFIGLLLEPHLGRARFLSAYLLTGIAASVASLWWHAHVISAGASGAIFGMYGVFLAMLTTNLIEKKQRTAQLVSMIFFIGYNLANGVNGGIDNAAHIGGLTSGILIGYLSVPALKRPGASWLKYATIAACAIITLALSVGMYKNIPIDNVLTMPK